MEDVLGEKTQEVRKDQKAKGLTQGRGSWAAPVSNAVSK